MAVLKVIEVPFLSSYLCKSFDLLRHLPPSCSVNPKHKDTQTFTIG